jgi:hypothetical protein
MSSSHLLVSLASTAYQTGSMFGFALRCVGLSVGGAFLVRRVVTGRYGSGFRRSPLGSGIGLVVVVIGLGASLINGPSDRALGKPITTREAAIQRMSDDCVASGTSRSLCDCMATSLSTQVMQTATQFADFKTRLNRAIASPAHDFSAVPEMIQAARICAHLRGA